MKHIRTIFTETLTEHNKWSMKRISAFVAFWAAIAYEFVIGAICGYDTHEYVWDGLLMYAAALITGSVFDKKFSNRATPATPPPAAKIPHGDVG